MTNALCKENLLAVFPIALKQDDSLTALWEETAEAFVDTIGEIDRLSILTGVKTLEETLLDILAYDYKVDWWNPEYSLEEKRSTLAGSWLVHRFMGTKSAVETALRAIYPDTTVEEWFQYDGDPFTFRLIISIDESTFSPDKHEAVMAKIKYYKNLRSWLEGIVYKPPPTNFDSKSEFLLENCTFEMDIPSYFSPEMVLLDGKKPLDGEWILNQTYKGFELDAVGMGVYSFDSSPSADLEIISFDGNFSTDSSADYPVFSVKVNADSSSAFTAEKLLSAFTINSPSSVDTVFRFGADAQSNTNVQYLSFTDQSDIPVAASLNQSASHVSLDIINPQSSITGTLTINPGAKLDGSFKLDSSYKLNSGTKEEI